MARPRVFVSSTCYDLKHIRSSLNVFIESLGFDCTLSEKGNIAYVPDVPLDESCYREAGASDIFVLIIGGRYGSEISSSTQKSETKGFYEHYVSITKKEYEESSKREIPTYILIEASVYAEYHTFLKNKNNTEIQYAYVDSVNVFSFIEDVLSKHKNNPMYTFDKFSDIENWLREQWSGLFRELLKSKSNQQQLTSLVSQVSTMKEVNETLKNYLEAVMKKINPDEYESLIESEEERLKKAKTDVLIKMIESNPFTRFVVGGFQIALSDYTNAVINCNSLENFIDDVSHHYNGQENIKMNLKSLFSSESVVDDFNDVRRILGLSKITT